MPAKRVTMRQIREVLRLRLAVGLSIRQISASTKISVGAIQNLLSRAKAHGLCWPLPDDMDDIRLAALLYPDLGVSYQDAETFAIFVCPLAA